MFMTTNLALIKVLVARIGPTSKLCLPMSYPLCGSIIK